MPVLAAGLAWDRRTLITTLLEAPRLMGEREVEGIMGRMAPQTRQARWFRKPVVAAQRLAAGAGARK